MSGVERSQRGRAYPMLGRRHSAKRRRPGRVVSSVTVCPATAVAFGVAQPVAATMTVSMTLGVSASMADSGNVAVAAFASTCPSATFSPALTAAISVTVSTAVSAAVTPFGGSDIVGNRQRVAINHDGAGEQSGDYGYRCDQAGGAAEAYTAGVISTGSAECFSHGSLLLLQA